MLLFLCRCCLRCVAWFSYWFDNLGFITEGNTYRSCAASSLPHWGNTNVVQAASKRFAAAGAGEDQVKIVSHQLAISGAVAREKSSTSTRFLITNHISLQCTLFSICLSFFSPPLHKSLPFYSPSFSFAVFS